MTHATFPQSLNASARADAARPLVTFYDDATGERVELSVVTYLNWVNKTAGLVQDELDLTRGDLVLLDLPTHWLGAVWLGAAWTAGLVVTTDPALAGTADLVVCGPEGVDTHADADQVTAISLRPLGGRFVDPLPAGVIDYGAVVLAQPDAFVSYDPPGPDDEAWRSARSSVSQAGMLAHAEAAPVLPRQGRLLTDVNPCAPADGDLPQALLTLLSPMLQGGGAVWVAHPDEERWPSRYTEERAAAELRASR